MQHVPLSSAKAPASAPAGAVVGGQELCAHSVATECRAFLFSYATTCRRGAGDLVKASGNNVTSCCLDLSRQFHQTGEHGGQQNQLEPRPAISTTTTKNDNNVDIG